MAQRAHPLPIQVNPFMRPENTPAHQDLADRRRLGTTDLAKASEGVSERFDYGHLRVPLPKDLKGSGVFKLPKSGVLPQSYFLMQRSSDGHISATGLFKATFPWASQQEEKAEVRYIESLSQGNTTEIAGNVWVAPDLALQLSLDYGVQPWLRALLDPTKIEPNPNSKRPISHPPRFKMPPKRDASGTPGTQSIRKRSVRSASPTKIDPPTSASPGKSSSKSPAKSPSKKLPQPTPDRPKKSPRKPSAKKAALDKEDAKKGAKKAAAALQNAFDISPIADSDAGSGDDVKLVAATADQAAKSEPLPDNTIRVNVTTDVEEDGGEEAKKTSVRIEMPADSPELKLPHTTEGVLKEAEKIIDKAKEMQDGKSSGVVPTPGPKSHKRKASMMEGEAPEELVEEVVSSSSAAKGPSSPARSSKRTRLMVPADEYRRERIQKRALLGLSASLAIGAMIPFVSNLF